MINLKFLEFICSKYVIDFFCFFFFRRSGFNVTTNYICVNIIATLTWTLNFSPAIYVTEKANT